MRRKEMVGREEIEMEERAEEGVWLAERMMLEVMVMCGRKEAVG